MQYVLGHATVVTFFDAPNTSEMKMRIFTPNHSITWSTYAVKKKTGHLFR